MNFARWLELTDPIAAKAKKLFRPQQWNPEPILKALNIKADQFGPLIHSGSFATIFQHPLDSTKVIKCTRDSSDAKRLIAAQSLYSPNVVKVYQYTKISQGYALVEDFVSGPSMPYTSSMMALLLDGPSMMDTPQKAARKILRPNASPARTKLLARLGLDTDEERRKLSELFIVIGRLQNKGIWISDWTDNVLDTGKHYVIIDMGQ